MVMGSTVGLMAFEIAKINPGVTLTRLFVFLLCLFQAVGGIYFIIVGDPNPAPSDKGTPVP